MATEVWLEFATHPIDWEDKNQKVEQIYIGNPVALNCVPVGYDVLSILHLLFPENDKLNYLPEFVVTPEKIDAVVYCFERFDEVLRRAKIETTPKDFAKCGYVKPAPDDEFWNYIRPDDLKKLLTDHLGQFCRIGSG